MIRIVRMLLAVMGVCAIPSLAIAQDEAFKQGLEARGDKKWAEVVRHMQNAVRSDGQESTRKVRSGFLGVQGMEYLPHYFLGEAYFNLQDCGGAITEWSASEQQSALKIKPEFVAVVRKGYQECAKKGVLLPADYNPMYLSTRQAYMDASALAKRVSDLGTANRDVWRADAGDQYEKANKELATSVARLTAGQRTRLAGDFAESKAASDRAIAILRPLESSLNSAVEALSSVQRLSREVEQIIAGADATNDAIEGAKSSLTDALQAARKSGGEQLTQARERLAVGQKTQNPAVVSEALKYAQSASTGLTQVLEQARKLARGAFEQQLGDSVRAVDEAFSRVSAAMTALDRRSSQKPELVQSQISERAALDKQVQGLRRRFERARKTEDSDEPCGDRAIGVGSAEVSGQAHPVIRSAHAARPRCPRSARAGRSSLSERRVSAGVDRTGASGRTVGRAHADSRACLPRGGALRSVCTVGRIQPAAAHAGARGNRAEQTIELDFPAQCPSVCTPVPESLPDRRQNISVQPRSDSAAIEERGLR